MGVVEALESGLAGLALALGCEEVRQAVKQLLLARLPQLVGVLQISLPRGEGGGGGGGREGGGKGGGGRGGGVSSR